MGDFFEEYEELKKLQSFRTKITIFLEFVVSGNVFFFFFFFSLLQERHTELYRLIVVGHSLGAGTAAILAMLLRPSYPDLFCYAFSPPGATLRCSHGFILQVLYPLTVNAVIFPRGLLCMTLRRRLS